MGVLVVGDFVGVTVVGALVAGTGAFVGVSVGTDVGAFVVELQVAGLNDDQRQISL